MESGESSSNERYAVFKDSSWFRQFRTGSNPWMARYVYGLIFLVATLLAWAARDYGRKALTEMEKLEGCKGVKDCLGAEGVLRVSLGCFAFFITLFLSTAGTSKLYQSRNSWHSGWWFAKIVMWIGFTAITFLLPSVIIQLYGEIAHFGAGVFLLIQLTSIISFIMWLNDCCLPDKNAERCQVYAMLLATTAYVVCLVGIILMYIWYTPQPSCLLNIFFITWTLVLLQLMTSVSLHPKVNAGILTPGLMGLYVVFICWCAIRSEPGGDNCIRKAEATDKTDWLTIIVIYLHCFLPLPVFIKRVLLYIISINFTAQQFIFFFFFFFFFFWVPPTYSLAFSHWSTSIMVRCVKNFGLINRHFVIKMPLGECIIFQPV